MDQSNILENMVEFNNKTRLQKEDNQEKKEILLIV